MDGITNVINVAPRETEPDDPLRFDVVGDRFGDVARADAAERRRNGERRAKVNYLGTVAKVLTSEMDDLLENLRRREANAHREISKEEAAFQRKARGGEGGHRQLARAGGDIVGRGSARRV